MDSIICRIRLISNAPTKAVILSNYLMNRWGCNHGQSIKICLGNKMLISRVVGVRGREPVIYLPPSIVRQLSIPYLGETRATFENRKLRIGPVLAILTTGFTGSPSQPFGSRSSLFRQFILAGMEERPFFYVFSPEMVNWTNRTITGWFYRKDLSGNLGWVRMTAPFPDVIYERVPNRKSESLPQVQACRERLIRLGHTRIFNQGFFNKWTIHEQLCRHPDTYDLIPETSLSPSIETVRYMLDKYGMIYLKPSGGSLGLGIFRITRDPDGGYYCRFRNGDKNILYRFRSLEKLIRYAFGNQKSRIHRYLVQQGIRLIKYQGRPVDFRVHMHKDRRGEWQIVGIGAKAAGPGSVTTHVRTGGSLLSSSELLQKVFGMDGPRVEAHIRNAAIRIAKTLEKQVNGPLGELGMDIGVDRDRRVWLFEVNSKPGRHIFHHPSLRQAGWRSAKYITEYSLKLANFL